MILIVRDMFFVVLESEVAICAFLRKPQASLNSLLVCFWSFIGYDLNKTSAILLEMSNNKYSCQALEP